MGTDQYAPWGEASSLEFLDLLLSKPSEDFFLPVEDGAVLADSPTSNVSPPVNWSVDQDRWKSSSTSSSHGDCYAEEQRIPLHVSRGTRKPPVAKGLHAQDEAYHVAREKNKAAQRAYRQRTKVVRSPRWCLLASLHICD